MKATAIVAVAMMLALALPCFAYHKTDSGLLADEPYNRNVKMALHLAAHASRSCNKGMPSISSRAGIVDSLAQGDIDAFLVVFDYDSITAVEYALSWPGGWGTAVTTHCGDLAIGTIVNPMDEISLSWFGCKRSGVTGSPAFWPVAWSWLAASSAGQIEIHARPLALPLGSLSVASCGDPKFSSYPDTIFWAGINTTPYVGPPVDAVQPTTWGAIKAMFR